MRHSPICGRFALLAWAALLPSIAAPLPGRVEAADAKPAKKDSRPAARPKEATFTTSVTPSDAKPGDTVTYKVTAKIEAPWHIYKYSKTQQDNGPKYTEFDFFDPADLKILGDWSPSLSPIKKKEPAFPDLPYLEFHEDEVTWSIKLQVPAKAPPGKKTLRCQIGYMICSDQNCSFPGQWTLPDAELTVLPGSSSLDRRVEGLLPALIGLIPPEAQGEAPKPAKKDSRIPKPKVVEFSTAVEPARVNASESATLRVTAKLQPGWHIFQYAKNWDGNGPKPTLFDAFDLGGLVPNGDWSSSKPPIRKKDPNFPDLEAVEFFEGEVTWSLPIAVPAGLVAGSKTLRVQAGYQICSNDLCNPPGQWTLPETTVSILEGGSAAPTAPDTAKVDSPPTRAILPTPEKVEPPRAESEATRPPVVSDIEKTARAGLIPFLLACAGAGLLALAMPCVWPMIPVTVNFFVKQGEKNKGKATRLAVAYCLSIIGIFTSLGLAFSAILGAGSLNNLANNPWLNAAVALLFFAFGLSLLGLFEIRLPNFLLNASAQGESRGGLIGVAFMASTLTITSFTCTFPVVGGLLVLASNGSYLYPVIGLATFATVVAFPFFLLALAPGLLSKMPRSGDWMNTVKVVGGLVEVGAAFKFVNSAEIGFHAVPEDTWCNEQVMLTIWVVMCLVCGIYLLGLFKTDHDYAEAKVGAGRLSFGMLFLFMALYLAPALFGQTPTGPIFDRLVVGLLPPKGSEVKATSSDPEIAITQEKSKHGVVWGMSYEAALAQARRDKKLILIDFTGVNCSNCRQMERSVMPRSDVVDKMKDFVTIQLHTDFVPIASITQDQREELGAKNSDLEQKLVGERTMPEYVVLDPTGSDEKVLNAVGGYVEPSAFINFLDKAGAKKGRASVEGPNGASRSG